MRRRRYYCFVAGLTDLVFDNTRNINGLNEFREGLKGTLHPEDHLLASVLFLPHDNNNLISFLEGKDEKWDPLGTYSKQDFSEQRRINGSILKEKDILPDYMVRVMSLADKSEEGIEKVRMWKALSEGYIDIAVGSGNRFLRRWITFDTDLNNILTLSNSRIIDINADDYIIGDGRLARELVEIFNSGKDFAIPAEPEYASMIFKIAVENEFLEREKKIDTIRWDFIDDETFFEYFTIDWILGYLLKLMIVIRWIGLDPDRGKEMLERLIKDIDISVPSADLAVK